MDHENNQRRSRSRNKSSRKRRSHRRSRSRSPHHNRSDLNKSLELILNRLNALEDRRSEPDIARNSESLTPPLPQLNSSSFLVTESDHTKRIVEAINSLKTVSTHNYYVSNFDPSVHDVDVWFQEVDRAQLANRWDDNECLSRVSHCLKGDAKCWLGEWVTHDRTWSNFKKDFKSLCVKYIDVASILFDVMCTDSDAFATYSDYARRSLLRLKIVKGLSDELITAIVLRGIKNPHVKACAVNSKLGPNDLVSFLSTFIKPQIKKPHHKENIKFFNREIPSKTQKQSNVTNPPKCYFCGEKGHKQPGCPKKNKSTTSSNISNANITCVFCKKIGHTVDICFAKKRSENRNPNNVNFCSSLSNNNNENCVAVIQGIPVDVLIDSGALNVSLISSDIVNHFSCEKKSLFCELKGVGSSITKVSSYVTLTIEFSEITLDVDLLIVPSHCMNAPIIIGTDVLNRDGVVYIRTRSSQRLSRVDTSFNVSSLKMNLHDQPLQTPLEGENLVALQKVISDFKLFMISGVATTTVTTGTMQIRLNSDVPVNYRPYKMSYNEKLKVREIIKDLLAKSIIRESESSYSSPILLVKKKNGSDRMCVDFRALNKITIKDRFPLPLIDDHIDRLGKATYFSVIDMASGFYQIRLDPDSIQYTGFVTSESHYEFLKMPYGLANAPVVYQKIITKTLLKYIQCGQVLVYIDDVLLLSSTISEGIQLLREVLQTLTQAGFSINIRKCTFLSTEIEYLGRVICNGQVRPSLSKIEALTNSPVPQNIKQVRQFLGLAGYFRRYIANYANKTSCISRLLRKEVPFSWGPEQETVRLNLISCLTNEPILSIFDPELKTEVHTDASSIGYGAVLIQIHQDGSRKVVAYFSKLTLETESRYHSYELETLAVVKALKHFRHYLIGISFVVVTDCNALKATQNKKDLLPRVARWWMFLQDYNFVIQYRKGTMLPHVDYLSRNPISVNNISKPRNWAQIAQFSDNETNQLLSLIDEGKLDDSRYVKRNDILYYKYTPVGENPRFLCFVPKGHRLSLLRIFHDEHMHINADKTITLILNHFWFPGLRQFVVKYISHCLVCLSCKRVPRAPLQPILSWEKPSTPFHTVHVDVLGPLPESKGYKHVFLIVDAFTKYVLLYPILRQDVDELKRLFHNSVSLFGTPSLIVADRGRMFESAEFIKLITEMGCEIHHVTPEMHHSNGQVERYARTVLNMLRIEANHKKTEWVDNLWKIQLTLNITRQKTTQTSPLNLLTGYEGTTPVIRSLIREIAMNDVNTNRESLREITRQRTAERLAVNQKQQDQRINEGRQTPRHFFINDLVFVIKYSQSKGKLDAGMRGPYRVTKVLPSDRYELKLLTGSYGKTTYAAAQYMVPWRGEWTPETCEAFFLSDGDKSEDNLLTEPGPTISAGDDRVPGEAVLADTGVY